MKINRSKILKRLSRYLFKHKFLLSLALFLTISGNLFALLGPKLAGEAIELIEKPASLDKAIAMSQVTKISLKILFFYTIAALFSYFLSKIMIFISRKMMHTMRKDVYAHLMEIPVSFFDNHQVGDIISRVTYDIDTINASISTDFIQFLSSLVTIFGSLWFMLSLVPILVLVFAVTIPLSFALTAYITSKTQPLFSKRSKKLGELNGISEEMISGQKTIKSYSQENNVIETFSISNTNTANAFYEAEYYGRMTGPGIGFINNISLAFITIFGSILYVNGRISLGNIAAFVSYSRKFSGPINELGNIYGEVMSAFSAADRIFKLLDTPVEKLDDTNAIKIDQVKGDIKFKDVNFEYTLGKPVLKRVNFHAEQGETVAIVGETGAGKTTIANLLMRFYDVSSGNILLDDISIYKIARKDLRQSFSLILQDDWLFHGTIHENISYVKNNSTREEVITAAKAARIHRHISQLSKGYDTVINDESTMLSKGQKQLIIIARAMLMDAPILILDEATSNVDIYTELQIQQAMLNLMRGKTSFIIAHRLSTIKKADKILVIKDGKIVEQGNHTQLLSFKGAYRQMYDAQFA